MATDPREAFDPLAAARDRKIVGGDCKARKRMEPTFVRSMLGGSDCKTRERTAPPCVDYVLSGVAVCGLDFGEFTDSKEYNRRGGMHAGSPRQRLGIWNTCTSKDGMSFARIVHTAFLIVVALHVWSRMSVRLEEPARALIGEPSSGITARPHHSLRLQLHGIFVCNVLAMALALSAAAAAAAAASGTRICERDASASTPMPATPVVSRDSSVSSDCFGDGDGSLPEDPALPTIRPVLRRERGVSPHGGRWGTRQVRLAVRPVELDVNSDALAVRGVGACSRINAARSGGVIRDSPRSRKFPATSFLPRPTLNRSDGASHYDVISRQSIREIGEFIKEFGSLIVEEKGRKDLEVDLEVLQPLQDTCNIPAPPQSMASITASMISVLGGLWLYCLCVLTHRGDRTAAQGGREHAAAGADE